MSSISLNHSDTENWVPLSAMNSTSPQALDGQPEVDLQNSGTMNSILAEALELQLEADQQKFTPSSKDSSSDNPQLDDSSSKKPQQEETADEQFLEDKNEPSIDPSDPDHPKPFADELESLNQLFQGLPAILGSAVDFVAKMKIATPAADSSDASDQRKDDISNNIEVLHQTIASSLSQAQEHLQHVPALLASFQAHMTSASSELRKHFQPPSDSHKHKSRCHHRKFSLRNESKCKQSHRRSKSISSSDSDTSTSLSDEEYHSCRMRRPSHRCACSRRRQHRRCGGGELNNSRGIFRCCKNRSEFTHTHPFDFGHAYGFGGPEYDAYAFGVDYPLYFGKDSSRSNDASASSGPDDGDVNASEQSHSPDLNTGTDTSSGKGKAREIDDVDENWETLATERNYQHHHGREDAGCDNNCDRKSCNCGDAKRHNKSHSRHHEHHGPSQFGPPHHDLYRYSHFYPGLPHRGWHMYGPPHHGAPHHGAPHRGAPHHGPPRHCAPHHGPSHHGAPHHGPPHHGPPHHGPSHHGPPRHNPPHQESPHQGPPHQGPPHHGSPHHIGGKDSRHRHASPSPNGSHEERSSSPPPPMPFEVPPPSPPHSTDKPRQAPRNRSAERISVPTEYPMGPFGLFGSGSPLDDVLKLFGQGASISEQGRGRHGPHGMWPNFGAYRMPHDGPFGEAHHRAGFDKKHGGRSHE